LASDFQYLLASVKYLDKRRPRLVLRPDMPMVFNEFEIVLLDKHYGSPVERLRPLVFEHRSTSIDFLPVVA
jgi:hypothetical protein